VLATLPRGAPASASRLSTSVGQLDELTPARIQYAVPGLQLRRAEVLASSRSTRTIPTGGRANASSSLR